MFQHNKQSKTQERHKTKEAPKKQKQSQQHTKQQPAHFCANCGEKNEAGSLFCEECGQSLLTTDKCNNCGEPLVEGSDICENCGTYLKKNTCSFCGSDMESDDVFCQECGAPRDGIECPNCATLSMFNFCPKCNFAITDKARAALKEAQNSKAFQKVLKKEQELEALKQEGIAEIKKVQQLQKEQQQQKEKYQVYLKEVEQENIRIEEENRKIDEEEKRKAYYNFVKNLKNEEDNKGKEAPSKPIPKERRKPKRPTPPPRPKPIPPASEIEKKYNEQIACKREELQEALDAVCTAEELSFSSPQNARDYYSSRKPQIANYVWECYFQHAVHPNPENCGQPQFGGKWIIDEGVIEWVPHDGNS